MTAAARTEGRHGLRAFRLTDVPIEVRRSAGALMLRHAGEEGNLAASVDLTRAIEHPSDRVYWIPADAFEDARRTRARWST